MKPETPAEAALRALRPPEALAYAYDGMVQPRTAPLAGNRFVLGATDAPVRRPGGVLQAVVLLGFLTVVTGCATPISPSAPVSKATIAALEVSVTEAEVLATAYLKAVPACPAPAPCSSRALRDTLITNSHAAHDAFIRLQTATAGGAPAALAAANEAYRQLVQAIPAVPAGR